MILRASEITKTFGPTVALSNVSLSLVSGEVHAVVGENGAGKSTLFKVLSRYEDKDNGLVFLDDKRFEPESMEEAKSAGVVLVMQELTVNPSLGIAENVYIDRLRDYASRFGIINKKKLQEDAQSILEEIGSSFSVRDNVGTLDVGQLKILEVARALSNRPKVILLDESTAFLNRSQVDALLKVVDKMRDSGLIVGFISHHLDEVQRIADHVTILKDGQYVGDYIAKEISRGEIESLMVGRKTLFDFSNWKTCKSDEVVLSLDKVDTGTAAGPREVSFSLYSREILGIGGLEGSGGQGILECIAGERKPGAGTMELFAKNYEPASPHDAWQSGVAYLPGNRTGEGLVVDFSVLENLIMTDYPRRGPFVDRRKARELVSQYVDSLRIKTSSIQASCRSLSGGNMQKVLLAKCLFARPRVLLLNNPTRGVDVGSRFEIYEKIRELVRTSSISVIMLSEDLLELLGLSDRILIMNKGHIQKEISRDEHPVETDVISYMT